MSSDNMHLWSNTGGLRFYQPPTTWEWDVFGGGICTVRHIIEVPWRQRVLTKVFLGSKWTRLDGKLSWWRKMLAWRPFSVELEWKP